MARPTRKPKPCFATPGRTADTWYDLFEDYGLIEASFAQQYGIRLRREDDMSWDEFATLLAGLNGDTPLGHVVSIRAENDKERLKNFTAEEHRIRSEWREKNKTTKADGAVYDNAIEGFAAMFKSIAKGGG